MNIDIEALSMDHGTVDGVRSCGKKNQYGWPRCRRCKAEQALASLGFARTISSRFAIVLRTLADRLQPSPKEIGHD